MVENIFWLIVVSVAYSIDKKYAVMGMVVGFAIFLAIH